MIVAGRAGQSRGEGMNGFALLERGLALLLVLIYRDTPHLHLILLIRIAAPAAFHFRNLYWVWIPFLSRPSSKYEMDTDTPIYPVPFAMLRKE